MPYLLAVILLFPFALALVAWRVMVWMPGKRWRGSLPPLAESDAPLCEALRGDLRTLAEDIGERNVSQRFDRLVLAAAFIEQSLQRAGYATRRQEFCVGDRTVCNIDVECRGSQRPDEILVVGSHYDTVPGSPGANDNGSAVVANLALARAFADRAPASTIRFAFFVNEEFPYYMTEDMGALRYAERCQQAADNIVGMICLETIGCYLDEPQTQAYPVSLLKYLYPTTGNFVAVVGNIRSRRLVRKVVRGLRQSRFPTEGMAAPPQLKDIFRSDHAAFWHCGYAALMITDTANFRYRHYHTAEDTVDKINFPALAQLVSGLESSLAELAG